MAATKNPFIGWGASKPKKPPTAGLPGGLETCNSGSRSIIDRPKSLFFLFLFSSFLLSLSLASFWFYSLMFVYCVCLPWGVYVHAYSITGNVFTEEGDLAYILGLPAPPDGTRWRRERTQRVLGLRTITKHGGRTMHLDLLRRSRHICPQGNGALLLLHMQ